MVELAQFSCLFPSITGSTVISLHRLISMCVFSAVASACLENALPPHEWVSGVELEEFRIRDRSDERAVFLMARDFVFSCNGNIIQWIIRWHYRDASPFCATIRFLFYVLRQSQLCGLTTKVGSNEFSVVVDSSRDQTVESVFKVDPMHRISVQKGDIAAVIMTLARSTCPDVRARIGGRREESNMYHGQFETFSQALVPGLAQPCVSYTTDRLLKPFFTAVVGKSIET